MPQFKLIHLFVIIGLIWAGILASLFFNRPPQPEFFEEVQSREFRLGLFYRGPESCVALASLDRLDLLVVGNSHVHSGIDAEVVARTFPRQRTGVCGLGTFRPERFADLFEYLDAHELQPRRIIFLVDPYFISEPISDYDGAVVRSALFDDTVRGEILSGWAAARDTGQPLLGQAEAEIDAFLSTHAAMLETLDLGTVEQIVAENTLQHEIYSEGFISRLRLNTDLASDLDEVCQMVEERQINIDLLGLPDGPYRLIEHDLDIGGVEIADAIDYFAQAFPCERRYIKRTLEGWGLDVRYRLNSRMDDEFDYTLFADANAFGDRYAALPSNRARAHVYDTSHLNRIGTVLFTERALQALDER